MYMVLVIKFVKISILYTIIMCIYKHITIDTESPKYLHIVVLKMSV